MVLVHVYELLLELCHHQLARQLPDQEVQRYYSWFHVLTFFVGRIFFSFVKFYLHVFHGTLLSLAN